MILGISFKAAKKKSPTWISYTLTQSGHYRIDISDSFGTHLSNSPLETYLSPSVIFASECEIIFPEIPLLADLKAYKNWSGDLLRRVLAFLTARMKLKTYDVPW